MTQRTGPGERGNDIERVPGTASPVARDTAGIAAIVLAAFLAYLPALRGGFVFDDHPLVESNRALLGPLWHLWTSGAAPDYWPLTWTALWIEHRLWGSSPLGYHVVGVALHATVALLLWRVLRRLAVPGAWLAAMLFVVHPVGVESVAWISEQKNVLSGVFFLAAALAWLSHDETRRLRALALATLLFTLACLAKGAVVMLPVVLAGIVLYRRGRLDRHDLAGLAPLFLVALTTGIVNLWFQHHNALAQGWGPTRGAIERVGGAAWALAFYVQAAFVPVSLGFVHEPWPVRPGSPWFLLPLALLGLGAVLLVAARNRRRWVSPLLAGLAYQAVILLPVLGLVDMAYLRVGPVSNHLQYLALMGPVALLAAGATTLARRSRLAVPTAAAAAVAFGLGTFQRATDFRDDERLWRAAVRDAPGSAFAHDQLAVLLSERGLTSAAQDEWAAAAELERDPPTRHVYRATWLASTGRAGEAADEARAAIASTDNPEVRVDAAGLLLRMGRSAEAIPVLRGLADAAPSSSKYAYLLANALWREGRKADAVDVLRTFCRDHPREPEMEKALGIALARSGQRPEALAVAAAAAGVGIDDARAAVLLSRWLGELAPPDVRHPSGPDPGR